MRRGRGGAVQDHVCDLAAAGVRLESPVQIHEEALAGKARPCAPEDCAICAGKQKLHKHKTYRAWPTPRGRTPRWCIVSVARAVPCT